MGRAVTTAGNAAGGSTATDGLVAGGATQPYLVDFVLRALGEAPITRQEIAAERKRQDAKWGGAKHDDRHSWQSWHQMKVQRVNECEAAARLGDAEGVRRYALQFHALRVAQEQALARQRRRWERYRAKQGGVVTNHERNGRAETPSDGEGELSRQEEHTA